MDYALAHGVNYFDTAPVYGNGLSEVATGIALHRHPRKSYFVATKMSDRGDHTLEGGKKMFRDSLAKLQIDYVDYYLLHAVGSGGLDKLNERFIDNGLLDWLCEQRDKGVIRNLGFSYHGDVRVFDWLLDHNEKYGFTFVQIEMNYIDWRHASLNKGGWKQDADAEYLYAKSEKTGVQNVVMEPLLGGQARPYSRGIRQAAEGCPPRGHTGLLGFPLGGLPSQHSHHAERHDDHGSA